MNQTDLLSKIAICLVEPAGAGNIGSVARAMKNTGLSRLILVGGTDPDCELTRQMASGHYDIIEKADRFDSLEEAIAPFEIIVGTSRRTGKSRRMTHFVRDFPKFLLPLLAENEAVILFGREVSGLTTEELDLCRYLVSIPTTIKDGSLNLAQAVLIVAYEIWMAANDLGEPSERKLATSQELEGMYGHIERMLLEIGFADPKNPSWMVRAFRHIFNRSGLDPRDVKIIRGVFSDIEWYLDHCIEVGKRDGIREKD